MSNQERKKKTDILVRKNDRIATSEVKNFPGHMEALGLHDP